MNCGAVTATAASQRSNAFRLSSTSQASAMTVLTDLFERLPLSQPCSFPNATAPFDADAISTIEEI